jgi:hypothetical protein
MMILHTTFPYVGYTRRTSRRTTSNSASDSRAKEGLPSDAAMVIFRSTTGIGEIDLVSVNADNTYTNIHRTPRSLRHLVTPHCSIQQRDYKSVIILHLA